MSRFLVAIFSIVALLLPANAQESAVPTPAITIARELRALSPEQAAEKRLVLLRGVVTLLEANRTIFLQDETAGSFIRMNPSLPRVVPGQRIEVEGVSYPGLYVPGIEPQKLRIVGTGSLPAPKAVTFEQLVSGVFNYEWVEVTGIVRSFRPGEADRGWLLLAMGNGRLEVHANTLGHAEAARLVDAAVRIQGLAAGFINDKRQLVAPHLRISDLSSVQVVQPAPEQPFEQPAMPASKLLQFSPVSAPGYRVKVRGVVTHQEPGRALFLRDESQGLLVETAQPEAVRPGDEVEVLGFAEMGTFSAVLRDASFRVVGRSETPRPIPADAALLLGGTLDADLVRIEAELLDVLRSESDLVLLLRAGDTAFRARLTGEWAGPLAGLRAGSQLRVAGVAVAERPEFQSIGFRTRPRSFELLLRDAQDVAVLRSPPWWTPKRLALLLGALACVAAAALAWAALLRRRVSQQMAIIVTKMKAEAATEERERIAREFHDTLEQELVGLALRLDAATSKVHDEKPRELLDGARRLVQGVQAGARSLVWNLRERALDELPLPEAIARSVAGLAAGRAIDVVTDGPPQRLSGVIEHELLRVAQEAATNAVKHGGAARIEIALAFRPEAVRMRISDDGCGFDPERDGAKPGHFGLLGMRERITKLGGSFTLQSQPGAGTVIEVSAPVGANGG